jgi:hypothetical protein
MRPPLWHPPIELSTGTQAIIKRIRRAKLCGCLRQHRHALFAEACQQELLTLSKDQPQGHPPGPPAHLALATLLQASPQVSDDAVSEATTMDRRWPLVLDGQDGETPPCSTGTLVAWRQRVLAQQMDRRLRDRTVESATRCGALGASQLPTRCGARLGARRWACSRGRQGRRGRGLPGGGPEPHSGVGSGLGCSQDAAARADEEARGAACRSTRARYPSGARRSRPPGGREPGRGRADAHASPHGRPQGDAHPAARCCRRAAYQRRRGRAAPGATEPASAGGGLQTPWTARPGRAPDGRGRGAPGPRARSQGAGGDRNSPGGATLSPARMAYGAGLLGQSVGAPPPRDLDHFLHGLAGTPGAVLSQKCVPVGWGATRAAMSGRRHDAR